MPNLFTNKRHTLNRRIRLHTLRLVPDSLPTNQPRLTPGIREDFHHRRGRSVLACPTSHAGLPALDRKALEVHAVPFDQSRGSEPGAAFGREVAVEGCLDGAEGAGAAQRCGEEEGLV